MLDESTHLWMLSILKDATVFLIRIPQTKLKQVHLEAVSIGKRTEHALCASNSPLWKPELFSIHVSIGSSKHCPRLHQAGCILWVLIRCIWCHFGIQSNLSRKINAFEWWNTWGRVCIFHSSSLYYLTCQGAWTFLRSKLSSHIYIFALLL